MCSFATRPGSSFKAAGTHWATTSPLPRRSTAADHHRHREAPDRLSQECESPERLHAMQRHHRAAWCERLWMIVRDRGGSPAQRTEDLPGPVRIRNCRYLSITIVTGPVCCSIAARPCLGAHEDVRPGLAPAAPRATSAAVHGRQRQRHGRGCRRHRRRGVVRVTDGALASFLGGRSGLSRLRNRVTIVATLTLP
jgi:hypothetical protein